MTDLAREEAEVWRPLRDRLISLLAETTDEAGEPCRRYPDGWHARARRALADFDAARAAHRLSPRPDDPTDALARARCFVEETLDDPTRLTRGDVAHIRRLIEGR